MHDTPTTTTSPFGNHEIKTKVETTSSMEAHGMTKSQMFRNLAGVSEDMKLKQKMNAGLIDNYLKSEEDRQKEEVELEAQERLRQKLVTQEYNQMYLKKLGLESVSLQLKCCKRIDRRVIPSNVDDNDTKDNTKQQLLNTSNPINAQSEDYKEEKFILYPESGIRIAWDLLLVFFLLYLTVVDPITISFQESTEW